MPVASMTTLSMGKTGWIRVTLEPGTDVLLLRARYRVGDATRYRGDVQGLHRRR